MKTLKKTLCLVLAMVMVFGLCVTSASAKLDAYEDKDTINYAEAVDVMTGIGVLAGDARGFRPGDDITRAEAAKIIAYIMIGDADRADALKATSDPFPDVPASHWAAGYISYCATADIIAGMGDGYHPNDNVTGLQFAKMLLKALGYGVNDEYIGTDWAINVSRDALRLGIFEKNTAGANNNKANREECALYAFNAIAGAKNYRGIEKVSYSALLGGYITSTGIGAYTGTDSPDANMGETFARDFKLEKEDNEEDAFGRDTGHHWILTTSKRPVITAEYEENEFLKANADDAIWATFTSGVTGADIYNVLGSDVSKTSTTLELYVNGTRTGYGYDLEQVYDENGDGEYENLFDKDAEPEEIVLNNFKKSNDKTLEGTGNGVQTFVYAKYIYGVLHVKICIVDTYLAQVTRVAAATGNKDAETTVKLIQKDVVKEGIKATAIPANLYAYETDEFEKDDYVLVTIAAKDPDEQDPAKNNLGRTVDGMTGEVQTMIPAITKVAEISKYSKRGTDVSVEADSTTHVAAKNSAGDNEISPINLTDTGVDDAAAITNEIVDGNDYTLYLDEFGYLIATSNVVSRTSYVYVAQFGIKISTEPKLTDKFALMAHVYYDDGTDGIVTVNTKEGIFETHNLSTKTIEQIKEMYGDEFDRGFNDNDEVFEIGLYSLTTEKGKAILNKDISSDEYTKYYCMATNVLANNTVVPAIVAHNQTTNNHDVVGGTLAADAGVNSDPTIKQYVTKGQARIDSNKSANRADSKTVFFYVNGDYGDDDYSVTVYTGINAVPSTKKDDFADTRLSEYAVSSKANAIGAQAVQAAVVDTVVEGDDGTIVYFFGGTLDSANYDKLNNKTVSYKVFGGDEPDRVVIEYSSLSDASAAIANLREPGFVKVKGGELEYIATSWKAGIVDKDNDTLFQNPGMTSQNPFYYVKEDNKVFYVNYAEIAGEEGIAGIHNHTVTGTVIKAGSDPESDPDETDDLLMPLYDVQSVVDLRTKAERQKAGNMTVNSVTDLLTLFGYIEDNHDSKDGNTPYEDNDVKGVEIDGLRIAISFTGDAAGDKTDVIKTIYILDNVECNTQNIDSHLWDLSD